MTKPWLEIIGIGEDGMDGLSRQAAELVRNAEVIIGGDRHHHLAADVNAERIAWPSPFDAMIERIRSFRGRKVVILVSGDPLWYSVGARIGRAIDPAEINYHPQLSAFQFASCRMGWSLPDVETLTIHGRPAEQIVPWFYPGAKLLLLTKDHTSPQAVAQLLCEHGYDQSLMTVLAALGGPDEQRIEGNAIGWKNGTVSPVPDLHTLAIELKAGNNVRILPKTGLPDDAFQHDGNITKQAVRALTLAKLAPQRSELLWDIGSGCGSVSIEWMRAAIETRAIGIEQRSDRIELSKANSLALGTPALKLNQGQAPEALEGLPDPDAVFIGGGLTEETIEFAMKRLKSHGRLVVNAVTLEGETLLQQSYKKYGGQLQRIDVGQAEPLGDFQGWKNAMTVTQWSYCKLHNQENPEGSQ